jgi:hypothetical protein
VEKVVSSRSFGLVFVALFLLIGGTNYWARGHWYVFWAALAAVVLAISLLMPRLLSPMKRLWLRFGKVLNFIVSPVVLGLVYVLAIIPVGALTRLFGKDLLSLKCDPSAPSYWIRRDLGGSAPESLKDQF